MITTGFGRFYFCRQTVMGRKIFAFTRVDCKTAVFDQNPV